MIAYWQRIARVEVLVLAITIATPIRSVVSAIDLARGRSGRVLRSKRILYVGLVGVILCVVVIVGVIVLCVVILSSR
jgi:hypothetical protein